MPHEDIIIIIMFKEVTAITYPIVLLHSTYKKLMIRVLQTMHKHNYA